MKNQILEAVGELADLLAQEDPEIGAEDLREAITTGYIDPDEIGEAFITGVMESLGLENNLAQRRDDKIEKVLSALNSSQELTHQMGMPPARWVNADRRRLAKKIVDALQPKKTESISVGPGETGIKTRRYHGPVHVSTMTVSGSGSVGIDLGDAPKGEGKGDDAPYPLNNYGEKAPAVPAHALRIESPKEIATRTNGKFKVEEGGAALLAYTAANLAATVAHDQIRHALTEALKHTKVDHPMAQEVMVRELRAILKTLGGDL